MDQDQEHLRLLSLFYYIFAGLGAVGSMFAGIYVLFGFFMMSAIHGSPGNAASNAAPAMVGLLFVGVGIFIMILGLSLSYCNYLVGKSLAERKRYTFCMVMAAICCLSVPIGTLLGIFTFIVISRPSVKALFS